MVAIEITVRPTGVKTTLSLIRELTRLDFCWSKLWKTLWENLPSPLLSHYLTRCQPPWRSNFFTNQIASERVGIIPSLPMDFVIPVGPLLVNICLSCIASFVLFSIIPKFREMFISAGLYGIDMNKLSQQLQQRSSSVTTNAQQVHENVQEKPKM